MENTLHEEGSRELVLFSLEREDENNVPEAFLYTELTVHHVHIRGRQRGDNLTCSKIFSALLGKSCKLEGSDMVE